MIGALSLTKIFPVFHACKLTVSEAGKFVTKYLIAGYRKRGKT